MNDPRVEAVARIIREGDVLPGSLIPPLDDYIGDAQQALTNADQADHEQGIHRVKVDDEAVEKVAQVLWAGTGRSAEGDWAHLGTYWRDFYTRKARAVLATLTGSES